MNIEEKAKRLKEIFDDFLKKNNAFDAWYERYRLDNLIYDDDVPIEKFCRDMVTKNKIKSMFYYGLGETAFYTHEEFFNKHKKCDILTNGDMINLDDKWMTLCDNSSEIAKLQTIKSN